MALSVDEVRYIAALARLRFNEQEEASLASEMSRILEYMDKLNEIDTTGVEPMSHVLDLNNVYRERDEAVRRITQEEGLKNAPDADSEYFRVPKVIE